MVRAKDTKQKIRKEKRDIQNKKGVKNIICKQKVRKAEADLRRK